MDFLKRLRLPFVRMRRLQKRKNNLNPDRENGNEDAVAGPSYVESSPKIFKLNIDCFDEIFDYLSLKDLHSFGQTCKRMNRVAGEYFKQNFSSAKKYISHGMIRIIPARHKGGCKSFRTPGFNKFMPCVSVYLSNSKYDLKHLKVHINEFESTNHIRFVCFQSKNIKYFKKLLPQLEILHFKKGSLMEGDIYDIMFKYGKNLREIYFEGSEFCKKSVHDKLKWLLQEYPKLEVLHLTPRRFCRIEELREFFVYNPNLHKFSTNAQFLWNNRDILLNSNVKLDVLELTSYPYRCAKNLTSNFLLELLNQLHEKGFYKRLYIYSFDDNQELCTQLDLVKGLEFLYIRHIHPVYNLVQLTNLRELVLWYKASRMDMEIVANGLTKLNRIHIYGQSVDVLMPFIRRSLNLNGIKYISHDGRDLNLRMLNEERRKLIGARKITIYVCDDVFLATKWTTSNGVINLNSIEMRRADSIEWIPYF